MQDPGKFVQRTITTLPIDPAGRLETAGSTAGVMRQAECLSSLLSAGLSARHEITVPGFGTARLRARLGK